MALVTAEPSASDATAMAAPTMAAISPYSATAAPRAFDVRPRTRSTTRSPWRTSRLAKRCAPVNRLSTAFDQLALTNGASRQQASTPACAVPGRRSGHQDRVDRLGRGPGIIEGVVEPAAFVAAQ